MNFEKDIVTLSNLYKSDLKKFLKPNGGEDDDISENTEYFLREIIGFDESEENFDYTDGFKSFPPIQGSMKGNKGVMKNKTDTEKVVNLEESTITDKQANTDREPKDLKVTFDEKRGSGLSKLKKLTKTESTGKVMTKRNKNSRASRNADLRNSKNFKSEELPDLNKKTQRFQKTELSKKSSEALVKVKKPKQNKLAITDGSSFPQNKSKISMKQQISPSKTSRVFAPKLSKIDPVAIKK